MSNKRKRREQRGEADPYRSSHELMPDEKSIRRLFEITYLCPLCQGVHETHQYVTLPADNLDDFRANAIRRLRQPELAGHVVTTESELHHREQGNFDELLRKVKGKPLVAAILNVEMTQESKYTCDDCGRTFENIAEHRLHMGVDPITGRNTPEGKGIPACHISRDER